MEQIKTHSNNFTDYRGVKFFDLLKAENVEFTPRIVTYRGEKVVLLHISGVMPDASLIDVDYWPRYSATEEDIKALPVKFKDIIFRVGKHTEERMEDIVDPDTGEVSRKKIEVTICSAPRFRSWFDDKGKEIRFNGKRSVYDETEGCSVWVEREEEEKPEETKEGE